MICQSKVNYSVRGCFVSFLGDRSRIKDVDLVTYLMRCVVNRYLNDRRGAMWLCNKGKKCARQLVFSMKRGY